MAVRPEPLKRPKLPPLGRDPQAVRERLDALIRTGKHSARKLLRARILLKADASAAGEALTDSQIAVGLHTSLETVARVRQQLVEDCPAAWPVPASRPWP